MSFKFVNVKPPKAPTIDEIGFSFPSESEKFEPAEWNDPKVPLEKVSVSFDATGAVSVYEFNKGRCLLVNPSTSNFNILQVWIKANGVRMPKDVTKLIQNYMLQSSVFPAPNFTDGIYAFDKPKMSPDNRYTIHSEFGAVAKEHVETIYLTMLRDNSQKMALMTSNHRLPKIVFGISPDGRFIACTSNRRIGIDNLHIDIIIWDSHSVTVSRVLKFNGWTYRIENLIFSADNSRLFIKNHDGGFFSAYDLNSDSPSKLFEVSWNYEPNHQVVGPLNCSRDGKVIVGLKYSGPVIFDIVTGSWIALFPDHRYAGCTSLSIDQQGKIVAFSHGDGVYVGDIRTRVVKRISRISNVFRIMISPVDSNIIIALASYHIHLLFANSDHLEDPKHEESADEDEYKNISADVRNAIKRIKLDSYDY